MLLGLDVGGTHTDAVIVDGAGVVGAAKAPTDHDHMLESIRAALRAVLAGVDPAGIERLNLSTTLSTNAIVEGKTEEVGVIVSAGPGINPENHRIGAYYFAVDGSVDHLGIEVRGLDRIQVKEAVRACRRAGVRVYAVVGKFSTRNPAQEEAIIESIGADADFVTAGYSLSGVLNFPRRTATACFNSAVWRGYNDFARAVEESVREFGIRSGINVLKADGGTMPLAASRERPVESILSGPAASVMGIIALCDVREDSIILDIGGTTTDIAVFADGAPVIEREGMTVGSYPTLVRALKIRSIGIGGDSALHVSADGVKVGPDRQGPALASCENQRGVKCAPALTDAMNYLDLAWFGDRKASVEGIRSLADLWGINPRELSEQAVVFALKRIHESAEGLLREINDRPVYTIYELLKGKRIRPEKLYVMGGPAQALAEQLAQTFRLEAVVPEHFAYANAVGAALTRSTMEAELFADTKEGRLIIPNLNVRREIPRDYDRERAERDVRRYLAAHLQGLGVTVSENDADIIESVSFNMVDGPVAAGKNIRVKCQIRPAVLGMDSLGCL